MTKIRVSRKRFILEVIGGIFVVGLMLVGPFWLSPYSSLIHYVFVFLGSILSIVFVYTDWFPMWKTMLVFDEHVLRFQNHKYAFSFFYDQIDVVDIWKRPPEDILFIISDEQGFRLSLKYLNIKEGWQQLELRINSDRFGASAYEAWLKQQPIYQEMLAEQAPWHQSLVVPLTVKPAGWIRAVGMFNVLLFGGLTIWAYLENIGIVFMVLLGLFVGLGLILLLPDKQEMDDVTITRTIFPFGQFQMRWDELERIDSDSANGQWVLRGRNQRLPIWGPRFWGGQDVKSARMWISWKIEQMQIPVVRDWRASYIVLPKNTRVDKTKR